MVRGKFLLRSAVSVLLIIAVIFTSSCGVKTEKIDGVSVKEYMSGEGKFRSITRRGSVKAAANDSAELYFDPENGSVSFYDRLSGDSWNSLPSFTNDFATNMVINVLKDSTLYKIDFVSSLKDSKNLSYEKTDKGVLVTYGFRAEDMNITVPVEYVLDGAFFKATIDMSGVTASENTRLVSIEFLPYLGAVRYSDEDYSIDSFGDWFLVPDGPGALIPTAVEEEPSALEFSVYGNSDKENTIDAAIGAYAVKQKDALLTAVVTEGEENTLIKVLRSAADDKNINRIYPEFTVTPISDVSGTVSAGKSYEGKFTVVYETLGDEGADYIGAAVSVRQILKSNGFSDASEQKEEYPLFISLIMSADGRKDTAVTSFSQAENLLTILKGKGVNEINLMLEGMFAGGLGQKKAGSAAIPSAIGTQKDFASLCSYAVSQNFNVYAGINLFSASSAQPSKNIYGEKNTFSVFNPVGPYTGNEYYEMSYLRGPAIERNVSGFINRFMKTGGTGVCVLDTCKVQGDFSSGFNASDISSLYEGSISALAVQNDIMLASADMHTLVYADYIKDIELYTAVPVSGYYTAVPFIPAVLHSDVIYSGKPVNLSHAPVLELLKSVEYGAVPYYVWCFDEGSDKYYDAGLSDAVSFYLKARAQLGDLTSRRITEHFMLEDGVYCTGYEGGVRVYVNYNNYSVVIGDVAVLPYDYLRIG